MAKITIRKKFSGGDPKIWMQTAISKIESANRESMTQAISQGNQLMKEFISTRGTANSGKKGRIETGLMIGAVQDRVTERTKNVWKGSFGWLDMQEDYFFYQNDGFNHVGSGKKVEGMYALQDAAGAVWLTLREDIERNIRDA